MGRHRRRGQRPGESEYAGRVGNFRPTRVRRRQRPSPYQPYGHVAVYQGTDETGHMAVVGADVEALGAMGEQLAQEAAAALRAMAQIIEQVAQAANDAIVSIGANFAADLARATWPDKEARRREAARFMSKAAIRARREVRDIERQQAAERDRDHVPLLDRLPTPPGIYGDDPA